MEITEGIIEDMKEPYQAAVKEDWKKMKKFYEGRDNMAVIRPTTVARDSSFHMAVYSGKNEPLKDLLELVPDPPLEFTQNIYENTILHEAAATGNLGAVKLLVTNDKNNDRYDRFSLLLRKNIYGETPLFTAAAYGSTKVVKYLAAKKGQISEKKLKEEHRHREAFQRESILHVAIQGEQFGTALELLKLDESLAEVKDKNGRTSLQLLATRPSAFRSGCNMGIWKRLFYFCVPVGEDRDDDYEVIDDNDDNQRPSRDLESGLFMCKMRIFGFNCILDLCKDSIRRFIFRGWPMIKRTWEEKRKHNFACELAERLIEKDKSWLESEFRLSDIEGQDKGKNGRVDSESKVETPLFLATKHGILEIVNKILDMHPQAVEHISHLKQNILHVAIMHRRKEVLDRVKKMTMPMNRLVRGIDKKGYTILHHAADVEHDTRETRPGPAYQLQEELKWFRRVQKLTPNYYDMIYADVKITEKNGDEKQTHQMTAKELFVKKHKKQLKEAQEWIKETSQSCSTVAVLVATVVFAAAYTVPGGSNDEGLPILIKSPFFSLFTVMDIVSLASSLTSVVMFLSILTSPFQFEDFHHSLPRKLSFGFVLLLFSLATTMVAFTATVLVIIQLEPRRWTSTLVYTAAFLPVSILALTQFPVFVSFKNILMSAFKVLNKVLPMNLFGDAWAKMTKRE